ncbi:MAG: zf-HC2 domain-containing protein [Sulfuricaulis sp.]|uniref:zf-HC2 domain-containing protein n=1 Tax=Sulfuricaulis sp. TaxID=2003553 RepID=UPI0025D3F11C|nr:zf-HC2 domain-containing protein [Sulfuricaulis sp.]MCR4345582.1 zf-HC2 domain-containing protein [Sulfuricaulis sp.]
MTATRSEHPNELLPWYVNGTLTGQEQREVMNHLETCERCRQEIAWLQKIRAQIKADESGAPGEFGLNRLMRDIRREQAVPARKRSWWQPALAAAAVIIVVQGAVLMNLLSQPEPIVPLGGPAAEGVVLQVRFHPEASEAQIRALLQQVRGNIVGGPGALGVYRLRLDDMAGEAAVEHTINELRVQQETITHVARE